MDEITKSEADDVLSQIKKFCDDSNSGLYYAPFEINSENFMDTAPETDDWCQKFGVLLDKSSGLTAKNLHKEAVQCFYLLFSLLNKIRTADIIFDDEVGSWMAGGDRKQAVSCYITSASKVLSEQEFVEHLILLIIIDNYESFSKEVYETAASLATKEQFNALKIAVEQQNIRTGFVA